jgi:hypothetical protein
VNDGVDSIGIFLYDTDVTNIAPNQLNPRISQRVHDVAFRPPTQVIENRDSGRGIVSKKEINGGGSDKTAATRYKYI